jgi:hypothetical protein
MSKIVQQKQNTQKSPMPIILKSLDQYNLAEPLESSNYLWNPFQWSTALSEPSNCDDKHLRNQYKLKQMHHYHIAPITII